MVKTDAEWNEYQRNWRRAHPGYHKAYYAANKDKYREAAYRLKVEYREFLQDLKLEEGCADCGYAKHFAALEFDHLPGTKKLFGIGDGRVRPPKVLHDEINKCDVVCSNCHQVRTHQRMVNA